MPGICHVLNKELKSVQAKANLKNCTRPTIIAVVRLNPSTGPRLY